MLLGILGFFLSFAIKPLHEKQIIVIDAGHGGKDSGVKIDSSLEKEITESIAKKISLLNDKDDIEIILLRKDDRFIELNDRISEVNKINPSLLISIHVNASLDLNKNGIEAYVSKENGFYDKSVEYVKNLVEAISNETLAKGKVKNANFHIIRKSNCPAVLLEVGFLSNENDKAYLTSEKGQNEIANKIFESLKKIIYRVSI